MCGPEGCQEDPEFAQLRVRAAIGATRYLHHDIFISLCVVLKLPACRLMPVLQQRAAHFL